MAKYSSERYRALVNDIFEKMDALVAGKGHEYSGDEDRLRNFRNIAGELEINMETVIYVYMKKHWDSIATWVKDQEKGEDRPLSEPIEGRIYDLMVYSTLLLAIIDERNHA